MAPRGAQSGLPHTRPRPRWGLLLLPRAGGPAWAQGWLLGLGTHEPPWNGVSGTGTHTGRVWVGVGPCCDGRAAGSRTGAVGSEGTCAVPEPHGTGDLWLGLPTARGRCPGSRARDACLLLGVGRDFRCGQGGWAWGCRWAGLHTRSPAPWPPVGGRCWNLRRPILTWEARGPGSQAQPQGLSSTRLLRTARV